MAFLYNNHRSICNIVYLYKEVLLLKSTVFNGRNIVPLLFAVMFTWVGVGGLVYLETDIVFSVVMFAFAAGFLLFLFLQPICFVFEKDKLTIRYFFGFHEMIDWEKTQKVILYSARGLWPFSRKRKYRFVVKGGTQGKKASFTTGEMPANKKTSVCMAKYLPEGMAITDETE